MEVVRRYESGMIPEGHAAEIDRAVSQIYPEDAALGPWYEKYVRDHRGRLAFDLAYAREYIPASGRVLEIGSLPPILTLALVKSGFSVQGVDLAPDRFRGAIETAQLRVTRVDVEREDLPFPSGSFDGILFNEVFEHLRINPVVTLTRVLRCLRPGGVLLLSTPNLRSFRGIRNFLLRGSAASCCGDLFEEYRKLETIGHMGHVREYTTHEVCRLLERLGLDVTEVVYRGQHVLQGRERLLCRLLGKCQPFFSVVARMGVEP